MLGHAFERHAGGLQGDAHALLLLGQRGLPVFQARGFAARCGKGGAHGVGGLLGGAQFGGQRLGALARGLQGVVGDGQVARDLGKFVDGLDLAVEAFDRIAGGLGAASQATGAVGNALEWPQRTVDHRHDELHACVSHARPRWRAGAARRLRD